MRRRGRVLAVALLLLVSACAPGSSGGRPAERSVDEISTDVDAMGQVTLTVWDQEVRPEQDKQITTLNALFQQKHPNIHINRVARSFDDLRGTVKLGLTGDDGPDVAQINPGKQDMGAYVRAGLIQPLGGYAQAYGWTQRFPQSVRQQASYPDSGDVLGTGKLYGVPQTGELVGIFYDKDLLARLGLQPPKTWADFDSALDKAKSAGMVPIQLGNLEKSAGAYLFSFAMHRFGTQDAETALATGRPGASWQTDANRAAARQLLDWVGKGYLTPGFAGFKGDDSWAKFAQGDGLFHIDGTWLTPDLVKAMHDKVGFLPPPPREGGPATITGGTGVPWAISAKSPHPDAAAAYLDFITSSGAMDVQAANGDLPVFDVARQPATGVQRDVFTAWQQASTSDTVVPYLDYATTDSYEVVTDAVEQLLGGKLSVDDFLARLQADLDASHGGR